MSNEMVSKISPYPVRMPIQVREWFEAQAKENGRSLNSEIVRVLTERKNRSAGRGKNA
ncbi:Arc family DNA-binding protein [Yersinia enterocolitica]|uniref:Arc family DNA-binding protein n=1 Tax=Yersinia enterocolitica TaxID=630 RepID=UPI0004012445